MYQVNPVIRLNRLRAEHAAMIELARAGYERDRGADLVEAAFKVGGSVVAAAGATLSASPGAAPWSRVKSWFARR